MRAILLILALAGQLRAACDQDAAFGSSGLLTYSSPSGGPAALGADLTQLSDGRILVVGAGLRPGGDQDAAWWAIDSAGNLSVSSALDGLAGGPDERYLAVAQAPSGGPVYLAGWASDSGGNTVTVLTRLSFPSLAPDASFGTAGSVTLSGGTQALGVAVDSSGRPYLGLNGQILRFTNSGALDGTYGSAGAMSFDGAAIAEEIEFDSQGRLYIAGAIPSGAAIWRLNIGAGSLDLSFGGSGKVSHTAGAINEGWTSLALDGADGPLASGQSFDPPSQSKATAVHYAPGGSTTYAFQDAAVSNTFGQEVAGGLLFNADGSTLLLGQSPSGFNTYPALWRLTAAGALDSSFGSAGQRVLGSPGLFAKARHAGTYSFATGYVGATMALWRFGGCGAVLPGSGGTPTPDTGIGQFGVVLNSDPMVFPQPASSHVSFGFNVYEACKGVLELFDERGIRVKSFDLALPVGLTTWPMPMEDLGSGVYLYRIKLEGPSGRNNKVVGKLAVLR